MFSLKRKRWNAAVTIGISLTILSILSGCVWNGEPHMMKEGSAIKQERNVGNADQAKIEQWVASHDSKALYNALSDDFQAQVTETEVQELLKSFWDKNEPLQLLNSYTSLPDKQMLTWSDPSRTKGISLTINKGVIVYMLFQPLEQHASDQQFSTNSFRMPFEGNWFVYWGGTNVLQNYHYAHPSQRYAYDFIITKDGSSFSGDPLTNENYYAFGQKVLAPADGVVVAAESSIVDNTPVGKMNQDQPAGNYVIIDHGHDEYSIIAHLKQYSVRVKPGDQVVAGQWIGDTGNSGNSSEAHIHYQVSNQADLFEGESIRIQFKDGSSPVQYDSVTGPPAN